jgi:hypothetical protein
MYCCQSYLFVANFSYRYCFLKLILTTYWHTTSFDTKFIAHSQSLDLLFTAHAYGWKLVSETHYTTDHCHYFESFSRLANNFFCLNALSSIFKQSSDQRLLIKKSHKHHCTTVCPTAVNFSSINNGSRFGLEEVYTASSIYLSSTEFKRVNKKFKGVYWNDYKTLTITYASVSNFLKNECHKFDILFLSVPRNSTQSTSCLTLVRE